MSTKYRIFIIIHLCLAFTALLYYASDPFLGHNFRIKSKMLICDHLSHIDLADKRAELSRELSLPYLSRLKKMAELLLFELPSSTRAWLFLSIFTPIAQLLRKEGAEKLPLLLLLLLLFPPSQQKQQNILPSESYLISHYLDEPLDPSISNQHDQLKKAFQKYLIVEWAKLTPSENEKQYQGQLKVGETAFYLKQLTQDNLPQYGSFLFSFPSLLWHALFLICSWFAGKQLWKPLDV